jgi:hypothetical protein
VTYESFIETPFGPVFASISQDPGLFDFRPPDVYTVTLDQAATIFPLDNIGIPWRVLQEHSSDDLLLTRFPAFLRYFFHHRFNGVWEYLISQTIRLGFDGYKLGFVISNSESFIRLRPNGIVGKFARMVGILDSEFILLWNTIKDLGVGWISIFSLVGELEYDFLSLNIIVNLIVGECWTGFLCEVVIVTFNSWIAITPLEQRLLFL